MLRVFSSFCNLDFADLMAVYEESNRANGAENWPNESTWIVSGKYVSAMRLEPYRDGMLLEALETAPDSRGKGYAQSLIRDFVSRYPGKIYSHIHKQNTPSIRVHLKCGFRKIADNAVYVDGSFTHKSATYLLEV